MAFSFNLNDLGGSTSYGVGTFSSQSFGSFDLSSLFGNSSNSSSSSTLSSVGGSVGGAQGAVVGGVLGALFGGSNGYLSNLSGFLETGSFSCLGKQTYHKARFDNRKVEVEQYMHDVSALVNHVSFWIAKDEYNLPRLRSTCSKKWCRNCLSFAKGVMGQIKSKYTFDEVREMRPYGSTTIPFISYSNPRLKGSTQHNPDGTRMSQEQYLALHGERLANEARNLNRDIRQYIAEQYYQDTGIRWNFNASSDGGWSVDATNQPTQIPWLLFLLVGGAVYLVTKDKK